LTLDPSNAHAYPPICTNIGLVPIKTKAVQIWEFCAHEAPAGWQPQGPEWMLIARRVMEHRHRGRPRPVQVDR